MALDIDNRVTISYDEDVKGFTSFHSYFPEAMGSLNNKFYSIKGGNLYVHDDDSRSVRNNFYGVQYNSEIDFVVNENPSDIKVLKTIDIEGNKAVGMNIRSYLANETNSGIDTELSPEDFEEREGRFHAYLRRGEDPSDLSAKNTYGIGFTNLAFTRDIDENTTFQLIDSIPTSLISVGDKIYNIDSELLGIITEINFPKKRIIIDEVVSVPEGTYIYGTKDARIEGASMRGYNFEVNIRDEDPSRLEIFAINSNVFKSEPSGNADS